MIELSAENMDKLLERISEVRITEPIKVNNVTNRSRMSFPKQDAPLIVLKFYKKRIHTTEAETLLEDARKALERGNSKLFRILRQKYYNLTGFWF